MADSTELGKHSTTASHALKPLATLQSINHVFDVYNSVAAEKEINRCSRSSETSHKSEEEADGWIDTELSARGGHRHVRVSHEELTEEDAADVEASVREALRLLQDSGDGESEEEHETERWRPESTKTGYLDFVHEVMEDKWTLGSRNGHVTPEFEDQIDSEEEDNQTEEQIEEETANQNHEIVDKNKHGVRKEESQDDEWQEAYTAKGRVYYYNRRTRESSWKKPSQFSASTSEPQPAATDTKEEAESHSSVLRQSLGYHPCASIAGVTTMERQTTLFCCFCGKQQPCDQFAMHFQECSTVKFHKRRLSPLYLSFERALVIMSEDATLRSVQYASSFPDRTPYETPEASIQDSLSLLHSRRRPSSVTKLHTLKTTTKKPFSTRNRATDDETKTSPDQRTDQEIRSSSTRHASTIRAAKRKERSDNKKKKSRSPSSVPVVVGPAIQQMEMCRYCSRSFAEGRLAKHEAVCPRVFGNEGAWGRGTSSNQVFPQNFRTPRVGMATKSASLMPSSSHKLKDHTLQQSYKEHQATLVLCPCCHRKFAPSGAQQHIAICKGVQNRPKNPIPLLRDYAIAG